MKNLNLDKKDRPGKPQLVSSKKTLQKYIEQGKRAGKYKVEDFFRNPRRAQLQISPDGRRIAYLAPRHRRMNIEVLELGKQKPEKVSSESDRDIDSFIWVNNQTLVYVKDRNGDENFSLFKVQLDSASGPVELTPFANIRVQIIDELIDDDEHIMIALNKENPELFDAYKLNVNSGEMAMVYKNTPALPISDYICDHEGVLRAAVAQKDGVKTSLLYRKNKDAEFVEVITTDFKTSIRPLIFDFENPNLIYVSSNLDRDKAVIVKFDMEKGKEIGEILYEHEKVDVDTLLYSRKRRELIGYLYVVDKAHRHIIDEQEREIYSDLQEYFEPKEYRIVSHDRDEVHFIIRSFSDRSKGAYYLYNREKHKIESLFTLGEWLQEEDMSPMEAFWFESSDGLEIQGYMSLPVNRKDSKNVPLIVHPHGGPWVRDFWGFNPEIQLLAHHGYAVMQVNYRGSTGFGKEFWMASFKEWGQKMQRDITEAVQYVCSEYPIDKEKIGIYGGSYGGYATLAGLCYSNGLYACGIDYVGVSNLFTFLNTIPPYWKPYLEMMYEMVGDPEEDKEMLTQYSPALNSDKIDVPLFVVQGANDPRVNINESDQIVSSLRGKNVPILYMVKYDEGHGFRNEENKIEFYNAFIGYLKKHLS